MNTADLCDAYGDELQYLHPLTFRDFGGRKKFEGEISTVKCHDDNSKVKEALNEPGNGRVRTNYSIPRETVGLFYTVGAGLSERDLK